MELALPNLTISYDSAFSILLKARQFGAKVTGTDPDSGSSPADDNSVDALEFGPDDDTRHELISAISDLNDDEQLDLIGLVLLGRGDFTLDEWDAARTAAGDVGRAHIQVFITGIPLVSDYLEEGLSQFNLTIENFLNRI